MKLISFMFAIILLTGRGTADPAAQPEYSLVDSYQWQALELFSWKEIDPKNEGLKREHADELQLVLNDRLQTDEHHYLAASAYSLTLYIEGMFPMLRWTCQQYAPRADDYVYRNRCLYVENLDDNKRIELASELGEKAYKANPDRMDGAVIFAMLADYQLNMNRLNEGIRANKRQFEMTPPRAEKELASVKNNLALAYANGLLSKKLHKLSIEHYKEVLAWYGTQQSPAYRNLEDVANYNLGIAYLFLFQDYTNAIEVFKKALANSMVGTDAQVFLAFSYAKAGQSASARSLLKLIQLEGMADLQRFTFLSCYRDLTRLMLGDKVSVRTCLQQENPQADVLLHLTETFSEMHLPPEDENTWWRMFYKSFRRNILPDLQNSIEAASSEAELVRERAESRLKDLKLQNLSLYQYLVGTLTGLAVLLSIAGFMTWKARTSAQRHAYRMNEERARLQNILDSIEEGIFLIQSDLTMVAEESQHLQDILGPRYRKRMTLSEFLALSTTQPDAQAMQIACIAAAMGEDSLTWQLNQGNLMANICIGDKVLALFWKPAFRSHRLRVVFLALRDVTAEHLLKQANAKAQEDADKVLIYVKQILKGNPGATMRFLGILGARLDEIADKIKGQNYESILRSVHTIKGTARGLELADLSEIAHRLEDRLQNRDATAILEAFAETRSVARLYFSAQQFVTEGHQKAPSDLFQIVADLRKGIDNHLRTAGLRIRDIHVREMERLTAAEYEKVREILLHGIANACDHGFILPLQKGNTVNPPELKVEIQSYQRHRTLLIRDNGVGIHHAALQALAEASGWRPQADETWSDFLFVDGISTAATVSLSSGRGVGLAAVRQAAQALGGRVKLRDNEETTGTVLEVTWLAPFESEEQAA